MNDLARAAGYYFDITYDKEDCSVVAEIGDGFIIEGVTRIHAFLNENKIVIAFIEEDGTLDVIGESQDPCTSWEGLFDIFDLFISNLCKNFEIDKNIIEEHGER